jgi:beta-lactam-binding protein with PASTA domain
MKMAKKFRIDIDSVENYVSNHVRLFIGAVLIVVFLAVLAAVTVFFVNVRGEEQTMVPDIVGRELAEALVELQAKELYPRIQLRFTETAGDKGMILEQDPSPGTIVKAGRRIRLVVSRGVIIDRIADYVGRDIDDVRLEIAALKSENQTSFLSIKEPATYKVSTEKPGTILEQSPLYGTGISGPVTLSFVVSRGEENETINIPDFTGLSLKEALSQ